MNPYISDIIYQPTALRKVVNSFSLHPLASFHQRLRAGEFDRIVITGMGASYNAAYPAYLELTHLSIPVILVNAAELLHYMDGLIGTRTILWANSQSGRSIELLRLLERIESKSPACILASTNDVTSPLASAADICLPIHAGPETMVSTKTYINMLAMNLLATQQLTGRDIEPLKRAMLAAAGKIEAYLRDWQTHVQKLDSILGDFETLILLGRGPSMGTVWNGSLINKEAAKYPLEGMNAADFRHGPLELVSPGLAALVFAGPATTIEFNRKLALEIIEHGGHAFWVDTISDPELPTILIPDTDESVLPLAEILPVQMLTLVLAVRRNVIAGQFRIVGKVTTVE
jgi:glucosamine--fructose-6-phosphate aminotransferase (isomerizing)